MDHLDGTFFSFECAETQRSIIFFPDSAATPGFLFFAGFLSLVLRAKVALENRIGVFLGSFRENHVI